MTMRPILLRVKVEWWDSERRRAVVVCNRVFRTQKGADKCVEKYMRLDRENYRGSIQFLGYQAEGGA